MPDPGDRATYGEDEGAPSGRSRLGGIVAVLAMFGFGIGLWYVYDRGIAHGDRGPPPVVTADMAPVKKAPADPGGMVVPNTKTNILNQGGKPAEPKVESLLPPQELPRAEPAPKPEESAAPPVQAVAPSAPVPPPVATPSAPAAPPPALPAVSSPVANGPAKPAAEAAKTEAQPSSSVPPVPAPLPIPDAQAQAQIAAVPAPPAASGGVRIQLASLPDAATAEREWKRLQRANADLLGNLTSRVVPVQLEGKGTWYRLQAGPFADKAGAQQACDALKQRKLGCFLAP